MKSLHKKLLSALLLVATLASGILGSAAVLTVPASAANSTTVQNGEYYITTMLRDDSHSYAIDLSGNNIANTTNIQLYDVKSYSASKDYYICSRGNGWYTISIAANTKMVLDVAGGKKASGVNVQLYKYNGTDAQLWKFEDAGNGYVYIKNKLGYYLNVSGGKAGNKTNVNVYTLNKGSGQKWRLTSKSVIDKSNKFIKDDRFKNGASYGASTKPKLSSWSSTGCCAYAADYAYYVAGCKSPRGVSSYTKAQYIEPGDIIKVTGTQHWLVVLRRNGNQLTTIEGNWTGGKVCYSTSAYTVKNGTLCRSGKTFRTFSAGYHLT